MTSSESRGRPCATGPARDDIDAGEAPGDTTGDNEEIRRLRKENKRLREPNEILKAATVFFAGELDPRNR